jgi:hypothetical protein
MMTISRKLALAALAVLTAPALHAYWLGFGINWIDAELKYSVSEADSGLEAELIFPAQTAAAKLSAGENVGPGTLMLNAEYAFASLTPRGTDKDWQYGSLTVYSDSKTTLDQYYRFDCTYGVPLASNWHIGAAAYFDKWRMTWSDTRQEDYVSGASSRVEGNTVRFTQEKWGSEFFIVYSDAIGKVPLRTELGAELAWHKSTDEHLVRSFYTVSEDLLYGYNVALDIGLYSDVSSELFFRGGVSQTQRRCNDGVLHR